MNTANRFFVMLNHPSGGFVPLDNGTDDFELAVFYTEDEAAQGAESSTLGNNFGWQVFEMLG